MPVFTSRSPNTEAQSWIFKFTLNGRARRMGLRSPSSILADARRKRDDARQLLDGIDPIDARAAPDRQDSSPW